MRALILDGELALVDSYPIPVPGLGEALVRVTMAGICNTDLELINGYKHFSGILGHEFVGVVCASADATWVGKRVCGEINISCGVCSTCIARAAPNHCPNREVLGILGRDGAFAEFVKLPIRNLHMLPDHLSDEDAVFVEPLAAAFEILEQVHVGADDRIVVFGDGKLGALCAQVLAGSGAHIVVAGKHAEKLEVLHSLGIQVVNRAAVPPSQADIVVEATGTASGFDDAVRATRPRGVIVLKSTTARPASINLSAAVVNELTIVGSRCGSFQRAIAALSNNEVTIRPLISDRFPLAEGLDAIRRAAESDTFKVLLDIDS